MVSETKPNRLSQTWAGLRRAQPVTAGSQPRSSSTGRPIPIATSSSATAYATWAMGWRRASDRVPGRSVAHAVTASPSQSSAAPATAIGLACHTTPRTTRTAPDPSAPIPVRRSGADSGRDPASVTPKCGMKVPTATIAAPARARCSPAQWPRTPAGSAKAKRAVATKVAVRSSPPRRTARSSTRCAGSRLSWVIGQVLVRSASRPMLGRAATVGGG